jgi:uncharacterized protein (TIGR02996 family)
MNHDEAFLQAIIENPDDESLRLIYADWLEERGDLRGEFLRVECLLRGLPENGPEYRLLHQRLTELGGRVDVRWLAAACRVHLETGPWHEHPRRFPLNVPGPFYTCGDCLACEAPEHEAPDLLAELDPENTRTYFVRQPRTGEEIERACSAAEVCCVADVRYGGTDPKIITRLGNDPLYCDYLIANWSPRLVRGPGPPLDRGSTTD